MSIQAESIYVEILIRGHMEDLWRLTQTPDLHERWDLRFTNITYLPRLDEAQPQRFLYSTRLGFGLKIQGEGESVGNRTDSQGQRTSALKFWSNDPKSLIREGTGYWKYIPIDDRVRFVTGYDYQVRFGALGRVFDALIFRSLIDWATAWSFDRLRLWIEKGIDPAISLQRSLIHGLARLTLAFVWLYHGAIPKLIYQHPDELTMLLGAGVPIESALILLNFIGWAEVSYGVLFLLAWRTRGLFLVNIALMLLATFGVALNSPQYLVAAFNPVTLNVLVIALSLVGFLSSTDLPSARRCRRKRPEGQS